MIVLSAVPVSRNVKVWANYFLALLAVLICCDLLVHAQGTTQVQVTATMSSQSFLYTDGSWVNINVSCNTACGDVATFIDNYGWGVSPTDANGNVLNANTLYVPSSVLTPGPHTLKVIYVGNSQYASASTSVPFTILPPGAIPTTTTVSLSSNSFSAAVGAWAYISVNCQSACGSVDVKIDDVYDWGTSPLNQDGQNNNGYTTYIPITYQTPGPHHLTVYYLGNTTYAASQSAPYDFTIEGPSSAGLIYSFNISSFQSNGNVGAYADSVTGNWPSITHDGLGRLTAITQEIDKAYQYLCWNYDAYGNRTSQTSSAVPCNGTSPPPPTVGWNYNSSNQVTSMCNIDPSTSACYSDQITPIALDPNGGGNTTAIGATQYLYDAENRICAVQYPAIGGGPLAMIGYLFDAEGQRVAKGTITSWSCDTNTNGFNETNGYMIGPDGEQLTEVDGQGNWLHTNVFANGKLLATYDGSSFQYPLYFHFADWLGTRRVQTDYAGNIESTFSTLPFGEMIPQKSLGATEQLFTGLERDENAGLDHAMFREYSPLIGRWMSPDPYQGSMDIRYPQTFHRYAYVGNSPLSFTDPSGLDGDTPGSGYSYDPIKDIFVLLSHLFSGGPPGFHGSLDPRPDNHQIWDEHGGFHATPYSSIAAMIGDVGGWYPAGCAFGVCGIGPNSATSGSPGFKYTAKYFCDQIGGCNWEARLMNLFHVHAVQDDVQAASSEWPLNGNVWPGFAPQDGICSTGPLAPKMNGNPAVLKCCQAHDSCYTKYHCNYSSWAPGGLPGACRSVCNATVVGCIVTAK
jgi:RHS repeat-associated protein